MVLNLQGCRSGVQVGIFLFIAVVEIILNLVVLLICCYIHLKHLTSYVTGNSLELELVVCGPLITLYADLKLFCAAKETFLGSTSYLEFTKS